MNLPIKVNLIEDILPARPRAVYGTLVLFAVVDTGSKIILDYVIRRLDALSAGLKPVEGLNLR